MRRARSRRTHEKRPAPPLLTVSSPSGHVHMSMTMFTDDEAPTVVAEIDELINQLHKVREALL